MARSDLYRLAGLNGYVLDVQASLLMPLSTTVVVPLLPHEAGKLAMLRLNPIFEIGGQRYVMMTQSISAITKKELGAPVGILSDRYAYDVTNALDMLLSGF
jgi:toxin CcdB